MPNDGVEHAAATRIIYELQERIRIAHAYCEDPGNWSALDGRPKLLMKLLDGTLTKRPIEKEETL